jgi:hypothetical protein
MNTPTAILEQARRRMGTAGKRAELVGRIRDKVVSVRRAKASMMGHLRLRSRIRSARRIRANHSGAIIAIRRGACVSALVLLFSTAGVGGKSDLDASTAGSRVVPTGTIAPATAAPSPEPSAQGWNDDMAMVTSLARFKAH